jgi:hypothetical protein
MGRRTVGGLLFTRGGSILLFREDGSRHKANSCCSRHGCSSRHSHDRGKGKEPQRAPPSNKSTSATPRRPQILKNPSRKPPPQPHESSALDIVSRDAGSSGSETGRRSRDNPGRDLLGRLKERVNASRKRSLTRENSPSSLSSNGLSASSTPSSRSISRPSHRAASRMRKADDGPGAGSDRARRNGNRDARRNPERRDDDLLLVDQITRDREPAADGFLSGFMARYRNGLQGALSSLEDAMEDSDGYWRFDMGGTEEVSYSVTFLNSWRICIELVNHVFTFYLPYSLKTTSYSMTGIEP